MLTWEYPPRIVGGISRHCFELSKALARNDVDITIITLEFPGAPFHENINGVEVYRVKVEIGNPNFLTWVLLFNHFMEKMAGHIFWSKNEFDLIHVHDWLTCPVGISLKHTLNRKLILTMHSTEVGRSSGIHTPDSVTKDSIEWWGTYEASKIIAVSNSLKNEIINHFKLPLEKVVTIPNGVDFQRFQRYVDKKGVRNRFGINIWDKVIICIGRLTYQKGFQYVIYAMPKILESFPNTRLIIIGDGYYRNELERIAWETGVRDKVIFTGFVSDEDIVNILKSGDIMIVPSLYEPFGITALEGMASGIPVIVSNVGGLREIVKHEYDGIWVYPGNPDSITWGVKRIFSDEDFTRYIVSNAFKKVKNIYDWNIIAIKTKEVYKTLLE